MDRFGDSRQKDKDKTRQKPWVQDMLLDNRQEERVVGRDRSESQTEKPTSTASSANATDKSAKCAAGSTDYKEENMNDQLELAKAVIRTVEASLIKMQDEVKGIKNTYIVKIGTINDTIIKLKSELMYYEAEKERYISAQKQVKLLKKIIYWTYGSIAIIIILILAMRNLGWL